MCHIFRVCVCNLRHAERMCRVVICRMSGPTVFLHVQDRHCTYNVTLSRVRVTIVAVTKQQRNCPLLRVPNIKFHEIPVSGSRADTCGLT